ncbi:hypothetical protein FXO38_02574 [Capsicum annuum]|nr:hypothetical protein FXO38_02574 [Capsicum annuum]
MGWASSLPIASLPILASLLGSESLTFLLALSSPLSLKRSYAIDLLSVATFGYSGTIGGGFVATDYPSIAAGIMDLNFYNNFKNRYNGLNRLDDNPGGLGFDWLVFTFKWNEDMINYVREKRSFPHGKSWNKVNRILTVMNMEVRHFLTVEILLEEGKIKVYDYNLPIFDDDIFFYPHATTIEVVPQLVEAE